MTRHYDAAVVGGGFGGLGTALELTRLGARVVLFETLRYAGGCASTFHKDGYAFESGATLFSGLSESQLFGRWMREHQMKVEVEWLDPLVELRTDARRIPVWRDRERFVEMLASQAGERAEKVRGFFALQQQVANALWPLFDEPLRLPPLSLSPLAWHARRVLPYSQVLPFIGRRLSTVLARFGLRDFAPVRTFVDAICQISVQCSSEEAEAPFALAAMDYFWRGTGHVVGGIGALADGLVQAIRARGGEVLLACRVNSVRRNGERWEVSTRRGTFSACTVAMNVLPQASATLLGVPLAKLPKAEKLQRQVEEGWSAVMRYGVVRPPPGTPPSAMHLELVGREDAPFIEGNHVFVSLGEEQQGVRTFTASTHVPARKLIELPLSERIAYVEAIQARMRDVLEARAPEWCSGMVQDFTASPRTFERFTGRPGGFVGGAPRRAGFHHYTQLGPCQLQRRLWLVGDSVFPGQGTLPTAIGGARTAHQMARAC